MQALLAGEVPLVAVSFRDNDGERLAHEAVAAGVDVAELRIDQFSHAGRDHVLTEVRRFNRLPILATIRSSLEGGAWTGTETERLDLYNAVLPEVDAIDIELSSSDIRSDVVAAAKDQGRVVVVSHHDFETTPAMGELEEIFDSARNAGADVVKVSTMARSARDLRTLASLTLDKADLGIIVIAMGATGTVGRIFFPALGSKLTFSYIGDHPPAPGQLDFFDTFRLMRKFYPAFNEQKTMSMQLLEDV